MTRQFVSVLHNYIRGTFYDLGGDFVVDVLGQVQTCTLRDS
jgi:hypothetical protein